MVYSILLKFWQDRPISVWMDTQRSKYVYTVPHFPGYMWQLQIRSDFLSLPDTNRSTWAHLGYDFMHHDFCFRLFLVPCISKYLLAKFLGPTGGSTLNVHQTNLRMTALLRLVISLPVQRGSWPLQWPSASQVLMASPTSLKSCKHWYSTRLPNVVDPFRRSPRPLLITEGLPQSTTGKGRCTKCFV